MILKKTAPEETALDKAIASALIDLEGLTADTEEYAKITKQLKKLYSMKTEDRPDRFSKDTVALILANLAGIAIVVYAEHTSVIKTNGLKMVRSLYR